MTKTVDEWIADGTATTVPETVSTPAVEAAVVDSAPATPDGPARDPETGKFISTAAPAAPAPALDTAATATGGTSADATPTAVAATPATDTAALVEEFLEARRGDQPYQIPKDVLLPWKHGKQNGYAPIGEVLASDMQERDYRIKTQQAAEERRQLATERARFTAEQQTLAAERETLRQAMLDPEKLQAYNEHYEMMQKNPVYKKNVEDALSGRMAAAELEIVRENERTAGLQEAATNLTNFIRETASQYPGVDPERIVANYRRGLISGDIPEITEQSVHEVYKQEADYAARIVSPLQSKLTALEAKIASLTDTKAAAAHNAKTDQALVKAKAAPVLGAIGNGTAVGTSTPETQFKPFTSDQYEEKKREWARRV